MIFAEFLALIGILGAGGLGITAIVQWAKRSSAEAEEQHKRDERMHDDLRAALKARDYRLLDDWLVLYGERISGDLKKHVELRRDELYIEKNP